MATTSRTRKRPESQQATGARRTRPKGRSGTDADTGAELLGHYRQMLLVRRFEERTAQAYTEAKIGGYCHLNLGEEATVVGLMAAVTERDYLFTNYRDHGYALVRGMDPGRVMAELYGRSDGVSRGWGGSMHLFDTEVRQLGGYGIVGGQLPLAAGAGLAISYRGGDEVVLCQMGDGTTNIGAFHESLNLAALWDLPVVFVVVNNQLGMGTTVEMASAEPELSKRAGAYRMESARVDGNDVLAVREAATKAVERARTEQKPYLLETVSGRLRGHSVVDPATYRDPAEVEEVRSQDPVTALHDHLVGTEVADADTLAELDAEIGGIVKAAVEFAENSPSPDPTSLFDHTYATPVPNDSRRLPADPLFPLDPTAGA
ncbi:pyruvate dehydrogenase E1 component alpha subunit [Haloactinopolyspora alba]|uniref:Pyruvate dehydrogenase E1 component subunit alpha n=1 Tax=Haloactinopolyspora alba TaxID=648780 RepID=A0A2P8E738_9ACTN|nr:pyruvate dehydrogenase (acetyl-transferring) E1 component subunit alpha [Haloactinopolyspora alba]PSL05282.1 pyruvate dehydrogenase E1 component alpha subunit [Haloactinopolyspora alba]